MENNEKPLEKMTAKDLREMALGIPDLQGVHAMKKDELIAAIRKAKGLPEQEAPKRKTGAVKKKMVLTRAQWKARAVDLKAKREEALQREDWKMAMILRKRITRCKKNSRHVAV